MIKIYSNQNIENANVISEVNEITTDTNDWWMIYDAITKKIIILPQQCSGGTSSPFTMVIADSKEILEEYIKNNELIAPEINLL